MRFSLAFLRCGNKDLVRKLILLFGMPAVVRKISQVNIARVHAFAKIVFDGNLDDLPHRNLFTCTYQGCPAGKLTQVHLPGTPWSALRGITLKSCELLRVRIHVRTTRSLTSHTSQSRNSTSK